MMSFVSKRGQRIWPSLPRGLRVCVALIGLAGLAACASTGSSEPPPLNPYGPRPPVAYPEPISPAPPAGPAPIEVAPSARVTPPHLAGEPDLVRAALLLPFSAPSANVRAEAASMFDAAQLALFEAGVTSIVLIPRDTAGTTDGARRAARDVLSEGVDIILGPLFADGVRAAAEEAQLYNTPVIAFTNDSSAAASGALLISSTPEAEIDRVVTYAALTLGDEKLREAASDASFDAGAAFGGSLGAAPVEFAALIPANSLGDRALSALRGAAALSGGFVGSTVSYPAGANAQDLTPIVAGLARRATVTPTPVLNPDGSQRDEPTGRTVSFDAIVMPEGGVGLLSLAPLLPYNDVDPREVKFIGTSLWNDVSLAREPALSGGWFPAPDPDAQRVFDAQYTAAFAREPGRLAALAYDAVLVTAALVAEGGQEAVTREAFTRPEGFYGAWGAFRIGPDGVAERALAIMEVNRNGFRVRDPAPQSFVVF